MTIECITSSRSSDGNLTIALERQFTQSMAAPIPTRGYGELVDKDLLSCNIARKDIVKS